MRPLYEIDADIMGCVDTETGEIVDIEKLKALEMERDAKIEGVILWRKDLLAEMEAVKNEAKKLTERARVAENKAEQLKRYIAYALEGQKFKTERCSVSYRKTTSVIIDDFKAVPKNYWKEPKEDWVSKDLIKEALQGGYEVAGAHQEEKQSIIIK